MQLTPEAVAVKTENATLSYAQAPQQLFEQFKTNEGGLSIADAAERLTRDGRNEPVSYTHLTLPTNREV